MRRGQGREGLGDPKAPERDPDFRPGNLFPLEGTGVGAAFKSGLLRAS